MFLKLCAARLALAMPVTGLETVSISAQGMPKSVVRKVYHSAAFDTHSVNGLAVELQSLEQRVETIENVVQAPHLSLQQVGDVLSCSCRDSTFGFM
jgi:hypothetical protein